MTVASPPIWTDPTSATVDIQSGIWTSTAIDAICSALTILGGATGALGFAGKANQLVNGGFEVWQRGAGPYTASLAYTADRWQISLAGSSSVSVTRDATNFDVGSQYAMACVYTHNAASLMQQSLEHYIQLRGVPCTFSCRVKTTTASAARIAIFDGATTTYSGYHSGSGLYETLSVTATPAGAAASVWAQLRMDASATIFWDSATFCTGNAPLPYSPLPPDMDLARCQRYYEILGEEGSSVIVEGIATAGGQTARCVLPYKQKKPTNPTLTRNGTWALANATGQPTVAGDQTCCYLTLTSSAAGQFNAYNNVVNGTITAESNP